MTNYKSPQIIASDFDAELDYEMTPARIITAIQSMPSLADDDARAIIRAILESFPSLELDISL